MQFPISHFTGPISQITKNKSTSEVSQPETWAFVFWFWQVCAESRRLIKRWHVLFCVCCRSYLVVTVLVATALSAPTWTSQLNDMPQIGDQVQTSTLAFADHGAKITSCNCDGCDHAYWDSDRDTPRVSSLAIIRIPQCFV